MLDAGTFLDIENFSRNGGRSCWCGLIRRLVEEQRAMILQTYAYLPFDLAREMVDPA
jgi:hypothetical protein